MNALANTFASARTKHSCCWSLMLGHKGAFQALKFYNSYLQLGKSLFPKQLPRKQDKQDAIIYKILERITKSTY